MILQGEARATERLSLAQRHLCMGAGFSDAGDDNEVVIYETFHSNRK